MSAKKSMFRIPESAESQTGMCGSRGWGVWCKIALDVNFDSDWNGEFGSHSTGFCWWDLNRFLDNWGWGCSPSAWWGPILRARDPLVEEHHCSANNYESFLGKHAFHVYVRTNYKNQKRWGWQSWFMPHIFSQSGIRWAECSFKGH